MLISKRKNNNRDLYKYLNEKKDATGHINSELL